MANETEYDEHLFNSGRGNTDGRGDPQIQAIGLLKESASGRGEIIMFTFDLALITIMCIVQIPSEGTTAAPVYIKFKLRR